MAHEKFLEALKILREAGSIYSAGLTDLEILGPETLQKDQLTLLFKDLYSVTDKADGDRCFMFIDNSGDIYFLDSNINNVLKTDLKSQHRNCLIDGELIKKYNNDNILQKINS